MACVKGVDSCPTLPRIVAIGDRKSGTLLKISVWMMCRDSNFVRMPCDLGSAISSGRSGLMLILHIARNTKKASFMKTSSSSSSSLISASPSVPLGSPLACCKDPLRPLTRVTTVGPSRRASSKLPLLSKVCKVIL